MSYYIREPKEKKEVNPCDLDPMDGFVHKNELYVIKDKAKDTVICMSFHRLISKTFYREGDDSVIKANVTVSYRLTN